MPGTGYTNGFLITPQQLEAVGASLTHIGEATFVALQLFDANARGLFGNDWQGLSNDRIFDRYQPLASEMFCHIGVFKQVGQHLSAISAKYAQADQVSVQLDLKTSPISGPDSGSQSQSSFQIAAASGNAFQEGGAADIEHEYVARSEVIGAYTTVSQPELGAGPWVNAKSEVTNESGPGFFGFQADIETTTYLNQSTSHTGSGADSAWNIRVLGNDVGNLPAPNPDSTKPFE